MDIEISKLWIETINWGMYLLIKLGHYAKTVPYVTIIVPYVTADLITKPQFSKKKSPPTSPTHGYVEGPSNVWKYFMGDSNS